MRKNKKTIASESVKTKKIREKLRKKWKVQEKQITSEALAQTVEKIHQWIAANMMHRTVVKDKAISLFDQNQNAVSLSKKIQELIQKISKQKKISE